MTEEGSDDMPGWLILVLFVLGWVLLTQVVFPKIGIPT